MWVIYRVCVRSLISGLFLAADCKIWGLYRLFEAGV